MEPSELTLLVVDDTEENRDVLSRRLARRGFQVRVAEGGRQALDLIARERVDLVLLDIMMPGMDGFEVLRALRTTHSAVDLPVIMQTARSESDDIVEALGLGANDYVTKPVDFPVVLARIEAQLRLKRPRKAEAPAAPAPIGPNTLLADRYRLEAKIGSGNFGTVYRGRHLELDRPVAVKVLLAGVATSAEALARFKREGVSACRVRHPNAVSVLDFGVTESGTAYLVMELLEGRSLLEELVAEPVLTPERTVAIAIPVCGALAEAHAAGVVHRDVKPANIFLQRTPLGEVPKVLDFGIAKISDEASPGKDLTLQGAVLGTLAYMAPERFGTGPVDGKSDVYSLGVALYQMLTGRQPFQPSQTHPMALAMAHVNEPPPPLGDVNPRVPERLAAAVMEALRKRPEERPHAQQFARNLARALGLDDRFGAYLDATPGAGAGRGGAPRPAVDPDAATLRFEAPSQDDTPTEDFEPEK